MPICAALEDFAPSASTNTRNTILPDGTVNGLHLDSGERLTAAANVFAIPVRIVGEFAIAPGATLDLTTNVAIVDYGVGEASPLSAVRELLISGRGGSGVGRALDRHRNHEHFGVGQRGNTP